MKCYLLYSSLFLLICSCQTDDEVSPDKEQEFLSALSLLRSKGCQCGEQFYQSDQTLASNQYLTHAAEVHAHDMIDEQYFDHVSPNGVSPQQRVVTAGYKGQFLAENIAQGYSTTAEVLTAWQESTSHCEAMMDPEVSELGLAEVNGYWVLELGKNQ